MKKKLSLLLVLALILTCVALFVSCDEGSGSGSGSGKEQTTTTKKTEEETDLYLDDLPDNLNFENEEISFVIGEPSMGLGGKFSQRSVGLVDYVVGDNAVDDAIYTRNTVVEERLGVVITPYPVDDAITTNAVYSDIQSGASEFDVISTYHYHDQALALQGLVLNLKSLDDYDADYIDLNAEYWSSAFDKAGTYHGASYWATGDLSLRYIGGAYCTFVNTELYANAIESTFGSIYDVVRNGDWTLETLDEMGVMVFQDNGTTVGKADTNGDILGLVLESYDVMSGFWGGCNIVTIVRDPADNPCIGIDTSDEHLLTAISWLNKVLYKSTYYCEASFNHSANSMTYFAEGNALFTNDKLFQSENYLMDMEQYGIIPTPKSDSSETSYCTTIHNGLNSFGIYSGTTNIPATAATLEAMAALSLQTVTPKYYDMALKYRYTRDEDSAAMIDLIRSCVKVDFSEVWTSIGLTTGFGDAVKKGSISTMKSYESSWDPALELFLEDLDELQEQMSK